MVQSRLEVQAMASVKAVEKEIVILQEASNMNDTAKSKTALEETQRKLNISKQDVKRLISGVEACEDNLEKNQKRIFQRNLQNQLAGTEQKFKSLKDRVERSVLFGWGSGTMRSNDRSASGMDALLEETQESMNRSDTLLDGSISSLAETHEIGINILSTVGEQNETLLRTNKTAAGVNSTASHARSVLQRMSKRALYNKALLWTIILLLICINSFIVFNRIKR